MLIRFLLYPYLSLLLQGSDSQCPKKLEENFILITLPTKTCKLAGTNLGHFLYVCSN